MALVTRLATASIDTSTARNAPQITGLYAGEDLDLCAPCYIKSADGKVYMSNGTAANEAAEFAGFTPRAVKSGEPVTLFGFGTRMRYGSDLTPGTVYYIGATKGRLDTDATTGDWIGVAQAISATDIVVIRSHPVYPVGAVTLAGMDDLAQGSIIAGGAADRPAAVAVGDGEILVGDGTDVNAVAVSGDVALANDGTTTVSGLKGTHVDEVAEDNVIGGLPVLHVVEITGGAAGNDEVTLTHKTRIIDVWAVHTGGAGEASDTLQVLNGGDAITDAMDWGGADTVVVRAGEINDANHEIAAGGTLRVTTTDDDGGGDVGAGLVYVLGIRVE